jgi:hypothetical protein
MSKIYRLRPPDRRVWHALYFVSLYDSDGMTEAEAAEKLRRMADQIRYRYEGLLVLDLDEDSLNVCKLDE